MKKFLIIAAVLIVGAYFFAQNKSVNSDIEAVKNSSIPTNPLIGAFMEGLTDPSATIGSGIAKIAGVEGKSEWKTFKTDKYKDNPDVRCVQVTVNKTSDKDKKQTAIFQFLYNRSSKYVELSYFDVNGTPKNMLEATMALRYGILDDSSKTEAKKPTHEMKKEPTDQTVCVKEPKPDVKNIITNHDKEYYSSNTEYSSTILAATIDVNGDGISDIIYTDQGRSGSCGYSYSALLGSKDGSYKLLNRYIDCAASCVTLKKSMINGFKIAISADDVFTYDVKSQVFEKTNKKTKTEYGHE